MRVWLHGRGGVCINFQCAFLRTCAKGQASVDAKTKRLDSMAAAWCERGRKSDASAPLLVTLRADELHRRNTSDMRAWGWILSTYTEASSVSEYHSRNMEMW